MKEPLDGLVIVDKPAGMTSHDVVARVRKAAGTRKVGHAGTLDPMATGVLVLGVGRATRLLGYLTAHEKSYLATIRLGQSTVTDDAEGDVTSQIDATDVSEPAIRVAVESMTGEIAQIPASVSAIKVEGKRSYRRVREGEDVQLEPRQVTITRFDVLQIDRPESGLVDVLVDVDCSSGTYVRALARDIGKQLGVGGHLTELRRTASGAFTLAEAVSLESLTAHFALLPLAAAAKMTFPSITVGSERADDVRNGRPIPAQLATQTRVGTIAVFDESDAVLALMSRTGEVLRVVVGFTG